MKPKANLTLWCIFLFILSLTFCPKSSANSCSTPWTADLGNWETGAFGIYEVHYYKIYIPSDGLMQVEIDNESLPNPCSLQYVFFFNSTCSFSSYDGGNLSPNDSITKGWYPVTQGYYKLYFANEGGSGTSYYQFRVKFECTTPGLPTNPSPGNATTGVSLNPSLSWASGGNTEEYDVYFGIDSTPDAIKFQTTKSSSSYSPGTLQPNTKYYWRIDAVNGCDTTTGTVWRFTTLCPVPAQVTNPVPSNGAINVRRNQVLSWTGGANTTGFKVYFGTDSTPDETELVSNQSNTSYTPGTLEPGTTYYWKINSLNNCEETSGPILSFTTEITCPDPPTLYYPKGNLVGPKPTFVWKGVSQAENYQVYCKDADTGNVVVDTLVSGTRYTSAVSLTPGNYEWRVTANKSGCPGSAYSYQSFTIVPVPQLKYRFERMWPTLIQPHYFSGPQDVAADQQSGYLYITDQIKNQVIKLTMDGHVVTAWGGNGAGESQFDGCTGITVDDVGAVYVTDRYNHRVQKFDANGNFLLEWGSFGTDNSQFNEPIGIAVSDEGNVYIADSGNNRIQIFSSSGVYLDQWVQFDGSTTNNFNSPRDVEIDRFGLVYVADYGNCRILKLDSQGNRVLEWGTCGDLAGQFYFPSSIAIGADGAVFVSDKGNQRIQKFSPIGDFISQWGNFGEQEGQFKDNRGIALDQFGNIYVADRDNYRFQKFAPNGNFLTQWKAWGKSDSDVYNPRDIVVDHSGSLLIAEALNNRVKIISAAGEVSYLGIPGAFSGPKGITIDSDGNIYVVEWSGHRVKRYDADYNFIAEFGQQGSGEVEFIFPNDISADSSGYLYVTDGFNHRIQQLDTSGNFVSEWGGQGTGNGQFDEPSGIAVDSQGFIYVAEYNNNRIQKFLPDGTFIDKWGEEGVGDSQFNGPEKIYVDSSDWVYVADKSNDRIQVFSPDGVFIAKFGEFGFMPGSFSSPTSVVRNSTGDLYVTDLGNQRYQKFRPIETLSVAKAIVVAGGGSFPGNSLWDATQMSANFAYRTLAYQGFTKESIYYLTSDTDLDLDGNGETDDVDGDATKANLQQAITNWAANADSLVVYLVDHGGEGIFRISDTETLSASDLDSWLDQLQQTSSGKVTVVYDACESGSFISKLTPPAGKERVVITSTSSSEQAYFVTQGSVSFSNYFWTHIFNGVNVKNAFDLSKSALSSTTTYQHPLLDANGNGTGNETEDYTLTQNFYIGNGTVIQGDPPVIESASDHQVISDTNSAPLFAAGVTDNDGIARVWAVIRPPDYNQGDSSNPVSGLPSIDLMPVGNDRFEVTYDGFNIEGVYQIAIYARDQIGNTCIPVLTAVSVNNPLRRRAIIAIGGSQSNPIWPAMENLGKQAYKSLTFQRYTDNDIYFMSPVTFSAGVDGLTTLSNLDYAINTWSLNNTQDVVIYLIGEGDSGTFKLNATETLSAATLDAWIDTLQSTISGKVTVIYDAPQSGSFLPLLTPPTDKQRILISSTANNGAAHFLAGGDISFSKFFWRRVLDGMNVRDAFVFAKNAIRYCQSQVPQLDDNSNGIGNEKTDGRIARSYTLGAGIMLAGDAPLIGSVSGEQTLYGETSASIWAENVTTTGSIDKVWAVITPPAANQTSPGVPVIDLPSIDLVYNANTARYEGIYNNLSQFGAYDIAVYALDREGNLSMPMATEAYQEVAPDVYEEDDSAVTATPIVLNATDAQQHNFHDTGDQDWVVFYGVAGETYEIKTENLASKCDTVVVLYDANLTPLTNPAPPDLVGDSFGYGEGELIAWQCPADGIYYVQVRSYEPADYGADTAYGLRIYDPVGGFAGLLAGQVKDSQGSGVGGAVITVEGVSGAAITLPSGYYLLSLPVGTYTVTAAAAGYAPVIQAGVVVTTENHAGQDFTVVPIKKGDINGDGSTNITDAILCLQVLAGVETDAIRSAYGSSETDVNENGVVGIEELFFILQEASGMR